MQALLDPAPEALGEHSGARELSAGRANNLKSVGRVYRIRDIAAQRHTESLLAPILSTLGAGLLCLLPVGVACLLLWHVNQSEAPDVSSLLIEDALSERPKLLIGSPALKRIGAAEDAKHKQQTA